MRGRGIRPTVLKRNRGMPEVLAPEKSFPQSNEQVLGEPLRLLLRTDRVHEEPAPGVERYLDVLSDDQEYTRVGYDLVPLGPQHTLALVQVERGLPLRDGLVRVELAGLDRQELQSLTSCRLSCRALRRPAP